MNQFDLVVFLALLSAGYVFGRYTERKHFMESQWIPDNIRAGWVRDITKEVAPDVV